MRAELRERNWVYLSAQDLAGWHPLGEDLTFFFTEAAQADKSQGWLQLARLAESLHQQTSGRGDLLQSLYGFFKLFNRLATLMAEYPYVKDWQTAQRFYRDLIGQETIDLRGDPLGGLQVMGMLETRCLDFDHLIITSLNEDILPKGRSENSLIPFDIKREFSLPTYLDKDAVFAYHFYRLLQRAERVTLIYNAATQGLKTGEASRFLRQLELRVAPAKPQGEAGTSAAFDSSES
ncbi:MAG: hypothetical protein U5L96_00810 [Owenweeksia sp.]|nr:hypothetical protein [Owenweeksia sp.]